jgi:hypothetical protein
MSEEITQKKPEQLGSIGEKLLGKFVNTPIEDKKLESLLLHIVGAVRDLELKLLEKE